MLLEMHKRSTPVYGCVVKGRTLAPMMNVLDNPGELDDLVGSDNWEFDPRTGIVYLPDSQWARFGHIVVSDNGIIWAYDDWDELHNDYKEMDA